MSDNPQKKTELEHPTMKIPMKKKQQKDFKRGRSLSFQTTGNSILGQLHATQLEDSAGTARLSSFPALLQA